MYYILAKWQSQTEYQQCTAGYVLDQKCAIFFRNVLQLSWNKFSSNYIFRSSIYHILIVRSWKLLLIFTHKYTIWSKDKPLWQWTMDGRTAWRSIFAQLLCAAVYYILLCQIVIIAKTPQETVAQVCITHLTARHIHIVQNQQQENCFKSL